MMRIFGIAVNALLCAFNVHFCVLNGIDYTKASAIVVTAFVTGFLLAAKV